MKIVMLLSLTLTFAACIRCHENPEDQTPQQTGDFTFWAVCGECIPITDKFTIHDGVLMDEQGQVLADSFLQFAETLQTNMPDMLCTSNEETYGCGSCYDYYSFFVQTGCNGLERTWQFDPNNISISPEIKAYAIQVQEVFWKCAK